jgi:hypothetical protein
MPLPIITPLRFHFDGFFACRIATDPDPTDESRGRSGYTLALTREDPLDQMIRLQIDEAYLAKNARPPMRELFARKPDQLGVKVRKVDYGGRDWAPAQPLIGAPVTLGGADVPLKGATFDSRNNLSGNDDMMSFFVYPFNLKIGRDDGPLQIWTKDTMPPPWTQASPEPYAHRLSTFNTDVEPVNEVCEAIGVYDQYGYFRDRRGYLAQLIADGERQLALHPADRALAADIEGFRSRIRQIDLWGDRIISKLQARCDWAFAIDGQRHVRGDFGGTIPLVGDWTTRFWFGGWDGDLLIGFMRGSLDVPFAPRQG